MEKTRVPHLNLRESPLPEGPEIHRTADELAAAIAGQQVTKIFNEICGKLSVITIIDVVMFTLFNGVSGDAERECSDWTPCRSWC